MAGFNSISDEILLNIVSHVDSMRDLAALSAQCRRLYNFVDMPLRKRFHRIRLRNLKERQRHTLALQLIEILKEPKLGQYVRQLEISPLSPWSPTLDPVEETENEDVKLITAAMRGVGGSVNQNSGAFVASIVRQGGLAGFKRVLNHDPAGTKVAVTFEEAVGVLLIALCPNIQMLKVDEPRWPIQELLKRVNSKDSSFVALQELREVRLIIPAYDTRIYKACGFVECMRCFHRLPSIESISVSSICIGEGQFFRLAPGVSNISKIFIDHSTMSSHKLRTITEHPKALKEFRFSVGGRMVLDERSSDCYIQPKILGRALQLHKSSLQVLDLDADSVLHQGTVDEAEEIETESDDESDLSDCDSDLDDINNANTTESASSRNTIEPQEFGTTIGSFHDFTALTHLSIGMKLLLGEDEGWYKREIGNFPPTYRLADRLPPNLEYLCIRGFTPGESEHYTEAILEMMETRAECLPCLKEVRGVAECVPNSESVEDAYEQEDLLWEDTDSWASDDDSNNNGDDDDDDDDDNSGLEELFYQLPR